VTGLDYYVSRSYDPVSGLFLSADKTEGDAQELNPYAYVGGNPETLADPTGQMYAPPGGGSGGEGGSQQQQQQQQEQYTFQYIEHGGIARSGLPVLLDLYLNHYSQWALAESYDENVMHGSTQLLLGMLAFGLLHDQTINWNASQNLRRLFVQLQGMALPGLQGMAMADAHNPEFAAELQSAMVQSAEALSKDVAIDDNGDISSLDEGGPCSFTPQTKVETKHGEQAIGTLAVGEQVLAYNPKTRKMEDEPILHVWIHNDNDLVDLTLTTTTHGPHDTAASKISEVVHTNKKHPFFTKEDGFLPVAQLKLGMHVLRADGQYGVITGWKVVPGVKTMYNLTVQQDHTFVVGAGQWIVHNICPINHATKAMQRDVQPTIDRIRAGISDPHDNDGSFFQNRDDILPQQPYGYYREYVIRTSGISGPGPQRLIVGGDFDVMYYSPLHYKLVFYQL
jgi:hypothetical protein